MKGATVVCTKFPSQDDMKILMAHGISRLYFFGPIEDTDTVKLVNAYSERYPKRLEIVKLESSAPIQPKEDAGDIS